jgi:hypothetical protein
VPEELPSVDAEKLIALSKLSFQVTKTTNEAMTTNKHSQQRP